MRERSPLSYLWNELTGGLLAIRSLILTSYATGTTIDADENGTALSLLRSYGWAGAGSPGLTPGAMLTPLRGWGFADHLNKQAKSKTYKKPARPKYPDRSKFGLEDK